MSMNISRLCIALLALLLIAGTAQAVTGPETAQLLNRRYALTPAECAGNNPPYFCSGVLARPVPADHGQAFWKHGPEAIAEGAERFAYLRTDGVTSTLEHRSGYVFADRFTAISQDKAYELQGDDGAGRPDELLIKNWDEQSPGPLPLQGLFYDVTQSGALLAAQRDQLAYYQVTQEWLPILRMDLNDGQDKVFGFNQQDQLYVGYQVASRLNARYADTSPTCRDGRAAFYCNGVLIRTTDVGAFHAWNPSPNSDRINGVSFSYLRADTDVMKVYKAQGFVLREMAAPVGHPLTLACIYPVDTGTGAAGPGAACTFRSVCAQLGVTSVTQWLQRYSASPHSSCAFQPDPTQLQLNADIRPVAGDAYGWNEIMFAAWPQNIPEQLPLEAFIYSATSHVPGNGLAGGQHFQRDYFGETGRYLPLLRVTLTAANGQIFTFEPQTQNLQ
ncbi:hypothetical protein NVV94_10390 [Pseudomonas sp. LS1212]|uniref:hypothetical protein n=1 Tax=Pseudomonas sp. LS1212 TaxID=2972478 RepID=UPI00215C4E51|nr:hypothetical protein [Pseudomonas sp. LS1212]UVJ45911.1 hypothetical protein NVV94_10390 [Pseudomonas sp. LS1212]